MRQREFLYPLRGGNQKPTNRTEPDWNGWAAWLASDQGMDPEAAWLWIMDEQERLRIEHGMTAKQASRALDKALRKRRAKAA